ncbi:MAG: bifunctional phosphoribosyl-AMP cyclohydrolase/phosphoribosyl-ATP diphosphatase HisIE [Chitinophagales bacterium]|nr:bifunctional phosphoribosyl-AMP cyclohydrolase/phosphoribosyl-ATP diphosphatase HisIE [Chitinophagales bacterium]
MRQADFSKGLLPAIIQDAITGQVLMLGYMNEESFIKTQESGKVTFFSRSRNTLWTKGETSGNFLLVNSIHVDCDLDTILIQATPEGPTCHEGTGTCWANDNVDEFGFLHYLERLILDRKTNPQEGSYTNHLFNKGINRIAQKVGEEAIEVVIEAKDNNDELFKGEAADLLFHLLVLLAEKNISLNEVVDVLRKRHSVKSSK